MVAGIASFPRVRALLGLSLVALAGCTGWSGAVSPFGQPTSDPSAPGGASVPQNLVGKASIGKITGLAVDEADRVLVSEFEADSGTSLIAVAGSSGAPFETLSGAGPGLTDGAAGFARYFNPVMIKAAAGGLLIADRQNAAIRRMDASGSVSTLTTFQMLGTLHAVTQDASGTVYVGFGDIYPAVYKLAPAPLTLAGGARHGFKNGRWDVAFEDVSALCAASTSLFVVDQGNRCIRRVETADGTTTTFSGCGLSGKTDGASDSVRFQEPRDLAYDPARQLLYVADGSAGVRVLTRSGSATTLPDPEGIAVKLVALDRAGQNLYVSDGLAVYRWPAP